MLELIFPGIFGKPLSFFLNEDIEGVRRLLEDSGIWCSSISYEFYEGIPAGYFMVRHNQYNRALDILREAGIL